MFKDRLFIAEKRKEKDEKNDFIADLRRRQFFFVCLIKENDKSFKFNFAYFFKFHIHKFSFFFSYNFVINKDETVKVKIFCTVTGR